MILNDCKKLKIRDSITLTDRLSLINPVTPNKRIGIFFSIYQPEQDSNTFLSKYILDLAQGFYLFNSPNKTASSIYYELIDLQSKNMGREEYTEEEWQQLLTIINKIVGLQIRNKFLDKWLRIYKSLIESQYNVLDGYSHEERKNGDNTDKTTYNTSVENNGKESNKEETTTENQNNSNLYGFNSTNSVPSDTETSTEKVTIVGNADDNTSHNLQSKTGTEQKDFTISETITKTGRDNSASKLIEEELSLRNKEIFFDIIYKDIDSVATLQIYD